MNSHSHSRASSRRFTFAIRRMHRLFFVFAVAASTIPARGESPSGDISAETYRRRAEAKRMELALTGAGGCGGSNCHGGATPRPGQTILGNEWNLWYGDGKGTHFRAYKTLYEDDRSDRMAKMLYGTGAVAKERAECLACHALTAPAGLASARWSIEDGVACESCHGASEKWIGPHYIPQRWRSEYTVDQRTELGFYDVRDLVHRAEKCFECHIGTEAKRVTHAMLAAGHPPLTLELAAGLFDVPRHWRDEPAFLKPEEGPWFHVRAWAVGQSVALRESMQRLIEWSSTETPADLAFFECFACHHDLKESTWRQQRTLLRPPGEPVWEPSASQMPRILVDSLLAESRSAFEGHAKALVESLSVHGVDRGRVRDAAAGLRAIADRLAAASLTTLFDRPKTLSLLRTVAADGERSATLGYSSAVQTYSALRALYLMSLAKSDNRPSSHESLHKSLAKLHDALFDERENETPGAYDPFVCIEAIREFARHLPES